MIVHVLDTRNRSGGDRNARTPNAFLSAWLNRTSNRRKLNICNRRLVLLMLNIFVQ